MDKKIINLKARIASEVVPKPTRVEVMSSLLRNAGNQELRKKFLGKDACVVICEIFKEARSLLRRDDIEFFKGLITCGDGLYKVDFQWGKPIWLSLVSLGYKNTFAFSEAKQGGGIKAWVTLNEDDMVVFECDLDLEFAS
ncbi:Acylsugar acyltransferase 3 [Bienertia sinuspersici]